MKDKLSIYALAMFAGGVKGGFSTGFDLSDKIMGNKYHNLPSPKLVNKKHKRSKKTGY